jgi:hypothetical protein
MNGIHEVTGSIPVWSTNLSTSGSHRGHSRTSHGPRRVLRDHKRRSPRQPGKTLFEFTRGADRGHCELRGHGAHDVGTTFYENGELECGPG